MEVVKIPKSVSLTTEKRYFPKISILEFSMDVCIVCEDEDKS